jgi:DNA-binding NarL/FixJ family response regulator
VKSTINIAIAEDHELFRKGLVALLNQEKGIRVLFDAENGQELLNKMKEEQPHIVLLDIRMPVRDGRQTLTQITEKFPETKAIILSMHYSEPHISEFIAAGACGFLPKNCPIIEVIEAIFTVSKQGYYYDHRISKSALSQLKTKVATRGFDFVRLTDREEQIVRLLCSDQSVMSISADLGISNRTVEWHKKNIFEKTNCRSLAGLTQYAIKCGIITNPEELYN